MARPHKQTVDYFPHDTDASDGKTLTILQSKYGNDGYAFWFKLLQLLGKTPGHYYDFNNPADWEFLLAKTHQNDTETAKGILDTLSLLDAIDPELYQHGIIWCQKFVDGIADAYSRTVSGAPERPKIEVSVTNNGESANRNPKNVTEMPQTKLKEIKLNNNIYILIFDFWNSLKIIQHKKLTDEMRRVLKSVFNNYTQEEICQAMRNYAEILDSDDYFFKYRWTLKDFLQRGLEKFMDGEIARQNYRIREEGRDERPRSQPQKRRHPITYISGSGEDEQ